MASPIEKAKELIAYSPSDGYDHWIRGEEVVPILRLLVECEEGLEELARVNCSTSSICAHMRRVARALLDKLRSES